MRKTTSSLHRAVVAWSPPAAKPAGIGSARYSARSAGAPARSCSTRSSVTSTGPTWKNSFRSGGAAASLAFDSASPPDRDDSRGSSRRPGCRASSLFGEGQREELDAQRSRRSSTTRAGTPWPLIGEEADLAARRVDLAPRRALARGAVAAARRRRGRSAALRSWRLHPGTFRGARAVDSHRITRARVHPSLRVRGSRRPSRRRRRGSGPS